MEDGRTHGKSHEETEAEESAGKLQEDNEAAARREAFALSLLRDSLCAKCASCGARRLDHFELRGCLFDAGGVFVSTYTDDLSLDESEKLIRQSLYLARTHARNMPTDIHDAAVRYGAPRK